MPRSENDSTLAREVLEHGSRDLEPRVRTHHLVQADFSGKGIAPARSHVGGQASRSQRTNRRHSSSQDSQQRRAGVHRVPEGKQSDPVAGPPRHVLMMFAATEHDVTEYARAPVGWLHRAREQLRLPVLMRARLNRGSRRRCRCRRRRRRRRRRRAVCRPVRSPGRPQARARRCHEVSPPWMPRPQADAPRRPAPR
jgi:hypothetical protein